MKRITATFEIENDLQEHQLRVYLEGIGAKYIKPLPNTEHLKDNPFYKQLRKVKKEAELNLYRFINKNRE